MSFLAQLGRTGAKRLAPGARVLYQTEQLRNYAEAPRPAGGAEDDIVLSSFRKQQQQFKQLMSGLQNISIPLNGDAAAVKKYAAEVEGLKQKIGMPAVEEVIDAELEYKFACSGYDVRKFVAAALEGMEGSMDGASRDLLAAVEAAERESGAPLDSDNDKGWAVLSAKVGEIEARYGLQDKAKVRDDALFETYKNHIAGLRAQVEEDMDKARKADDLEWVAPDLAAFKAPYKLT